MQWVEPVEGFEYVSDTLVIDAQQQAEKLGACGLDPMVFGEHVDPSFFIGEAIHAGIRSGISAEGNVNMLQSLRQYRPANLGEPLTVRGSIVAVTEVPRGRTIDTRACFEDANGQRVISCDRRSLKPDPGKAALRGAGERPPPVVEDPAGFEELGRHRLTPDAVVAYSSEGNSIHYDMAAARNAGFRAPIIGGGMGVHFLLVALWLRFRPHAFDLDIYFRRPIFWDDAFTVALSPAAHAICIVRDGKPATEARINSVS